MREKERKREGGGKRESEVDIITHSSRFFFFLRFEIPLAPLPSRELQATCDRHAYSRSRARKHARTYVRRRNAEIMSRVIASAVIARVRVCNEVRLYSHAVSRNFVDAIFN